MVNDQIKFLQSIIENITDIVTIIDATGKILYESASIRSLGYTQEELVGKNAFDFIHPDDRGRVITLFMASVVKPGVSEIAELRFRQKDGSWRSLESSAKNLLFDPNIHGVVVCSRDISDRKKMEEQMQLQISGLEAASNGIVITDSNGSIIWTNPAFTHMTGYSREEAKGQNPRILKSGETPDAAYAELWKTIKAGKNWHGELINRRKDGSLYFEYMVINPIKNAANEITHFVAVKTDISNQKKLEAQLVQSQKMEAVGRLAGGIAHDFNNLLTVILGRADFLRETTDPSSQSYKDVEEIHQAGLRASNLTRQLLAFSRKQILQSRVMSLNQILADSNKMIRRLIGEDIEFVILQEEKLKPVKIDASQMEQVIMNLAVNSRDAMKHGGKLILETHNVTVTPKMAERDPGMIPGEFVLLKVTDTGEGMPPEVVSRVFEPFFTTKEKGKGTGLGLSTVYGIIKQSHGFIYADSTLGQGTTIRIYLPVAEASSSQPASKQEPVVHGGHETILLVEDEEIVRGIATLTLKRHGYQVVEATNGMDALRIAQEMAGKEKIDLLLTDMVMPHMGGGELASKFSEQYPGIKMMFTSGYTDQSAVQKWIEAGCKFLHKPYTPSELLQALREALDQK